MLLLLSIVPNFWWRFFRLLDLLFIVLLLFFPWANCVPGSNQSEKWSGMTKQKNYKLFRGIFFSSISILRRNIDKRQWQQLLVKTSKWRNSFLYCFCQKHIFYTLLFAIYIGFENKEKHTHTIQSMQFFNDKTFVGHFCNLWK